VPSELEDARYIPLHKKLLDPSPAHHSILNVIENMSAAGFFFEDVFMAPNSIGAAQLNIYKSEGRIPDFNFRPPDNGKAV
jgi:hypothetical protein